MFRESVRWDLFWLKFAFERVPSKCGMVFKRNFENRAVVWGLFRMLISNETNPSCRNPSRSLTLCDPRPKRGGGALSNKENLGGAFMIDHNRWGKIYCSQYSLESRNRQSFRYSQSCLCQLICINEKITRKFPQNYCKPKFLKKQYFWKSRAIVLWFFL
jgi:hypothetical protein